MNPSPVVVVGAGPTGLVAACGLLAAGVPVRVIDRAPTPAVTSRALGLQPRGIEVLDRLGALADLPTHSQPIHQIVISIGGRELGHLAFGKPTQLVPRPGLIISQAKIEAALRNRLTELGGTVEWGCEVGTLKQDDDGVTVALRDGKRLRASWIIGCDGAHSVVRTAAGIGFPGVPLAERFLLADVHADLKRPHDSVAVWLDGQELLGAFPLPGEDLWRLIAPSPNTDAPAPEMELASLLRRHAASEIRSYEWVSTFRIHRRLADCYRTGRILLAGDAAHIHSPLGGQGMNTGIGDAENLAWKLALVAGGRANESLLDTYSAERRPVAEGVVKSTSSLTGLVLGSNALARMLRDYVFVPLINRSLVQRLIWEQASQLKVSYRGGPLAPRSWRGRGLQPGDRVPDLPCTDENGQVTRLHAELGPRWALLAPATTGSEALTAAARHHLGADLVARLVTTNSNGNTLLVRPDAHLAWSGREPTNLGQWISSALHHQPQARIS